MAGKVKIHNTPQATDKTIIIGVQNNVPSPLGEDEVSSIDNLKMVLCYQPTFAF